MGLRAWQQQALAAYFQEPRTDFLVAATPGAGKTTFALTVAGMLLQARVVDRIVIVVPTDHLRSQWQQQARAAGIDVETDLSRLSASATAVGYVTTYAQLARSPVPHRRRCENRRTFVILDEIHHAADGMSWGDAVLEAFTPAHRRLALTGTPFRSQPGERIPFISYEEDDEGLRCLPDYDYSYPQALADGAVRPVVFAAYKGQTRWLNDAGEVLSEALGSASSKRSEQYAWRTALHPGGKWLPHVIASADARLTDLRDGGIPDAGGLLLARDQDHARACARILHAVTGTRPTVVVSDDPKSSAKVAAFTRGTSRWLVAVRQVSEGVDVPRLCVAVWATTHRTPLFFAQAVGRVLRARNRHEVATVFVPAVRPLLALAAQMEEDRNKVLTPRQATPAPDADPGWDPVPSAEGLRSGNSGFTALDAQAEFAQVLHAGAVVDTHNHEPETHQDGQLALPGVLTAEHTARLLSTRDASFRALPDSTPPALSKDAAGLRAEIHASVQALAVRSGQNPAQVYQMLHTRIPGPPTRIADVGVLEQRRDWLLARGG